MANLPEKAKAYGMTACNFVRAIGPFLISQSEKASEEFAKHKARLALVDVMKEVMVNEAKVLQSIKEELLKRYIDGDDIERIRIKRDIREVEKSIRTLNIGQKAILYLPESKEGVEETSINISESWIDRFNELAKLRNEPWREELLARALAKESSSPGSVSPRALWVIGTLEEKLFHAFAALLDVSAIIGHGPIIPNGNKPVLDQNTSWALGSDERVGNLSYMLSDLGLIGDSGSTSRTFIKNGVFKAQYANEIYLITCKEELKIKGIIYTELGASIASFYDAKHNDFGSEIFRDWIDSLSKEKFDIIKV